MPQHTFRSEDDERLAPRPADLPAQQVKILRGGGRLADLHIFFAGELHKALDARARILRALALLAGREKPDQTRGEAPFVFTGPYIMFDYDLRAVRSIRHRRLPQKPGFRVIA